jgi:hypothetical protein
MEWNDVVEGVKKLLPAQMRVPFTTGVMVLAVFGLCTIFMEGFEWTEVFWVWWIPLVAAMICLYWAIVVVAVGNSIVWPTALSWIVAGILALVMVLLAWFSYDRHHYRYEKAGFFVLRNWQPDEGHGAGYFEWSLEPTTDASKSTISISMSLGENCDLRRFDGPAPVRDTNVTHGPIITDDSTLEHPNTRWKVKDLHRGEELKFRLFVKDENRSAGSICMTPIVNSN